MEPTRIKSVAVYAPRDGYGDICDEKTPASIVFYNVWDILYRSSKPAVIEQVFLLYKGLYGVRAELR
jgi:hypothetical protein